MQQEVYLAVEQDGLPKSVPSMDVVIADVVSRWKKLVER